MVKKIPVCDNNTMFETAREKWTGRLSQCVSECLHIFRLSLFISRCRYCEHDLVYRHERVVCTDCLGAIKMHPEPFCLVCGRPMGQWHHLCGECIVQTPLYRKHVSYSNYEERLRELILAYKYGAVEPLKHLFVDYYVRLFHEQVAESFDYIIPVPPDKSRNREFYPMLEIAKRLSKRLNIPLLSQCLVKIKCTEPQAGLSRAKRLANLDGAFSLNRPHRVKDKKILLIDDVYTTGTTMDKCTAPLLRQNADVVAMTLARSV